MPSPAEAERRSLVLPLAALLTAAVTIGFSPIFVRLADVGPTASAFFRVAIATPLLLAIVLGQHAADRSAAPSPSFVSASPAFLLCGFFFAGDIGLWHWSLQWTSVANATLLGNTASIFVTLVGWLFFRERVGALFAAGLALAIGGTAMLVGSGAGLRPDGLVGDLVSIGTGLFYAGYIVCVARLRASYSGWRILLMTSVLAAAMLLPLVLLHGERMWPATPAGWLPLVGLAFGSQVLGQGLFAYAVKHLPMSFASVTLLIQPVVAASAASLLFGEALTPLELGGGALVLAGIYVCRFASFGKA
jgi:drug/metabolite transporter (DMT)-like permease